MSFTSGVNNKLTLVMDNSTTFREVLYTIPNLEWCKTCEKESLDDCDAKGDCLGYELRQRLRNIMAFKKVTSPFSPF